jgi:hypothetical protein
VPSRERAWLLPYSTGNQILALVQCQMRGLQPGPINTFPKWKDLGRFVKRGERALTLCMPIRCKRREEDSDEEHTFTSFVYKARWFVLSQTDGQELEPITLPTVDNLRNFFLRLPTEMLTFFQKSQEALVPQAIHIPQRVAIRLR